MATARIVDFPQGYDFGKELRAFVATSELLDSGEMARAFAATVPESELRDVLGDVLKKTVEMVEHEIRSMAARRGNSHSSKWNAICEENATGRLDRYIVRLGLPEPKLLLDCTYDDLRAVADAHLAVAGSYECKANAYGRIARRLKPRKGGVVRDLREQDVLEDLSA